jgi:hypothetical protein
MFVTVPFTVQMLPSQSLGVRVCGMKRPGLGGAPFEVDCTVARATRALPVWRKVWRRVASWSVATAERFLLPRNVAPNFTLHGRVSPDRNSWPMSCGGTGTLAVEPVKAFVTGNGSSIKTPRVRLICLPSKRTDNKTWHRLLPACCAYYVRAAKNLRPWDYRCAQVPPSAHGVPGRSATTEFHPWFHHS